MPISIFEVQQGSLEWHQLRCGIITASDFQDVMTKGRGSEPSKTRATLIRKKAAERITEEATESYTNGYMERGKILEPIARELYEERTGNKVTLCGFIRNGAFGASVDGLVGEDGAIEIKTRRADLQIELLVSGELPPEHKAQVQGGLMVAEREWQDFVSYAPKMPLFLQRVYRDEEYISALRSELEKAEEEIQNLVKLITSKF